jgi:hypothetical protein
VLLVSVGRRALEARARERLGLQVTPVSVSPQEAWLDNLDAFLGEYAPSPGVG